MTEQINHIINESEIFNTLQTQDKADPQKIRDILTKARELKGLSIADTAALMNISDPTLLQELFDTARDIKDQIYGKRLVIFAPLYISNLCYNECTYCAFRAKNKDIVRKALSQEEIAQEVKLLTSQGHKRVLLVAGEAYPNEGFDYVLKAVDTVYATKNGPDEIRRVNVNVAPLSVEQFAQLKDRGIGTYQIFQETYHQETYKKVHLGGVKRKYDWRVTAMDRAMEAGIDDVGIGVLFGLFNWRFELLATLQHCMHLEKRYGVGPHTISVPRIEPATGSSVASQPPYAVSDLEFRMIVAILRIAVPYTGIIMSTRETPNIRRESFALGVSQISAGSRTDPGGYNKEQEMDASQFSLGDHRSLDEVVADIASLGYLPSFCTGCYRLGRTGQDFMDMAKPGDIRMHCDPNGVSTFQEYLIDYAKPETKEIGQKLIDKVVNEMGDAAGKRAKTMVEAVKSGKRDVLC